MGSDDRTAARKKDGRIGLDWHGFAHLTGKSAAEFAIAGVVWEDSGLCVYRGGLLLLLDPKETAFSLLNRRLATTTADRRTDSTDG